MKKLHRSINLIKTVPAVLAAVALLFLGANVGASGSKSKPKNCAPPKKAPVPKKAPPKASKPAPKCKPCNKCQPKPRPAATAYSGQASVLYFTNLPGTVIIADTGPLPS